MQTIKILGKELVSVEDTAKALGIAKSTVRLKYRRGEFKVVRVGKNYYIPADSLREYLEGDIFKGRESKKLIAGAERGEKLTPPVVSEVKVDIPPKKSNNGNK